VAKLGWLFALMFAVLVLPSQGKSQQLEYFGKPVRGIPVSSAVKVGKLVFVSGTPAYKDGKLAIGDFPAQMKQVMENISNTLKSAGTDWGRVVKTNVMLTRGADFGEMNTI
jgi:enamine deaminase RidA (YjgF/YER057c/UK114 family)